MTRKARSFREHRRGHPSREPYPRLLIVCEGAKTEPNYFKAARAEYRLSTANVAVYGEECGASPSTIVSYALACFERDKDYDGVFCVFDRDEHQDYEQAKDRCRAIVRSNESGNPCPFFAITSNPCFEYWLILHFEDTSRAFARAGKKSPGDCAAAHLKKHLPNYPWSPKGH